MGTVILLDNNVYMEGAECLESPTYYESMIKFMKRLGELIDSEPCYKNDISIFYGDEQIKIEVGSMKAVFENLEKNHKYCKIDLIEFWNTIIQERAQEFSTAYIFTAKQDPTFYSIFENCFIKSMIMDFSRRDLQIPNPTFIDLPTRRMINDDHVVALAEKLHLTMIEEYFTIFEVFSRCLIEFVPTTYCSKKRPKIRSIQVYGPVEMSWVQEIAVLTHGFLFPPKRGTYEFSTQILPIYGESVWREPDLGEEIERLDHDNVTTYINIRDFIDEFTTKVSENEQILLYGCATFSTGRKTLVTIRTRGFYERDPVVEEPDSCKKADDEQKEDEKADTLTEIRENNGIDDCSKTRIEETNGIRDEKKDCILTDDESDCEDDRYSKLEIQYESDLEPEENRDTSKYIQVTIHDLNWSDFLKVARIEENVESASIEEESDTCADLPAPSYTSGDVVWYHPDGLGPCVHKMVRALRKLPERTVLFEKEIENMISFCKMSQNKDYARMFSQILRNESYGLNREQVRVAESFASHFDEISMNRV